MVFGLWKRRKDMTPYAFYQSVMDQARQPIFFEAWGVPDTLGGRFDMLIAHAILVFRRLKRVEGERAEEAASRSQAFSDLMFKDLDRALRDTGVSDRNVPKRLKTLATAYLGRGKAFGEALDAGDEDALAQAIERNAGGIVFGADKATAPEAAEAYGLDARSFAIYLQAADAALAGQSDDAVLSGTLDWPSHPGQAVA
jgi:cytochrome b pre-mRNA-processing protein 3